MGIFSRIPESKLIAVFDIAGSSIGGILFFHHHGKLPEILATSRFSTDFFPEVEFKKIERSLHKTFERNIAHLKKFLPKERKKPDLAVIVFSSPYYVSQTKIIRLSKKEPFEITEKLIKNILNEEAKTFGEKIGNNAESFEIESMGYKLDDCPVANPFKKQSRKFEAAIYFGFGIKAIKNKLEECISHSFGDDVPVRFQSFPLATFNALKDLIDISGGLLLIDVGGEITDLVMIKKGIVEEVVSFPLGENFLTRRIASAFGFSLEESFSLLKQYGRGELHSEANAKTRKILESAGQKWCELFNQAINESPEFSSASQNRIILGGTAALALKSFIICTEKQPLTIQFLFPGAFKNHFIFSRGFSENKDIMLMLYAFFVENLFKKS